MKISEQRQKGLAEMMRNTLLYSDMPINLASLRVILPEGELTQREKTYIYNKYIKDETE